MTTSKFIDIPAHYVADASVALVICNSAALAYSANHCDIQTMLNHFDGQLPRDPKKMQSASMGWGSNVPYGRAFSLIQKETSSRLGVFLLAISFLRLYLKSHSKSDKDLDVYQFYYQNPIIKQEVENVLATCFISVLLKDPDWMQFLIDVSFSTVTWGLAPCLARPESPYSYCSDIRDVLFQPETHIDNVKLAITFVEKSTLEMYRIWKQCKESDNPLWNPDALEESLYFAITQDRPTNEKNWSTIYPDYLKDEAGFIQKLYTGKTIKYARIFNEEYDGKITETLYEYYYDYKKSIQLSTSDRVGSFITYQKTYPEDKEFLDFFNIIRNSGVRTSSLLQRMKGMAGYAYEYGLQYDNVRNSSNDALIIHMALKFQPESELQDSVFDMTYNGGIIIFPANYPLMRIDNASNTLSSALQMLEWYESEYNKAVENYNPQVSNKLKDRATNDQVLQVSSEVSRQKEDNASVYLFDMQRELSLVLKRIRSNDTSERENKKNKAVRTFLESKVQKEIIDRFAPNLEKDGKPLSATTLLNTILDDIDYVELSYMTNDLARLEKLIQISPNPTSQNYWRRRYAAALSASYEEQEAYFPLSTDKNIFSADIALALIENQLLWDTRELAVQPLQDHVTHLEAHFYQSGRIVSSIQQGMDPLKVHSWVANCLDHTRFHLQELAGDQLNTQQYEGFIKFFEQLTKQLSIIERLVQRLKAQLQSGMQQGQQAQDPENVELQAEIDRENRKLEAAIDLRKKASASRQEEMTRMNDFRMQQQTENNEKTQAIKAQGMSLNILQSQINGNLKRNTDKT